MDRMNQTKLVHVLFIFKV